MYFQLLKRMYLLHPETTKVEALPFYNPTDDVLWLSPSELVFANKREASEGEVLTPSAEDFPNQMVFYNREGYQNTVPLPFSIIQDIQVFASYKAEEPKVGSDGIQQELVHEAFFPKKENMKTNVSLCFGQIQALELF